MATVEEHYQQLLAEHYTWMFGSSFDEKVQEQKAAILQALHLQTNQTASGLAIDLGSGSGFQTIALAQLGFSPVIAIDTSGELLNELQSHASGLSVQLKRNDVRDLSKIVPAGQASVVVCMGDTLPHLPSKAEVTVLFSSVFDVLIYGGVFLIAYRDLTSELTGTDRFIPVRNDENTILTCFLEYENEEFVIVHDLVYTRQKAEWTLNKSSYRKLRLGVGWLVEQLTAAGFHIESQGPAGRLQQVVAQKL